MRKAQLIELVGELNKMEVKQLPPFTGTPPPHINKENLLRAQRRGRMIGTGLTLGLIGGAYLYGKHRGKKSKSKR